MKVVTEGIESALELVHWTQARTGALPAFLDWSLLALG